MKIKNILQKVSAVVVVGMIFFAPAFLMRVVSAEDNVDYLNSKDTSLSPENTGTGDVNYLKPSQSTSISPENTGTGDVNYLNPTTNTSLMPNLSPNNYGSGSSGYGGGSGATSLRNPVNAGSLPQLLDLALKAFVDIGAVVGVLAIVYCGFLFLKAQGNPEDLTKARTAFYWTIIGLAILLGASVLEAILTNTINSLKAGV